MKNRYPMILIGSLSLVFVFVIGFFIAQVPDTKSLQLKIEQLENDMALFKQNLQNFNQQHQSAPESIATANPPSEPAPKTELSGDLFFQHGFHTNPPVQQLLLPFQQKQSMFSLMLEEEPLLCPIDSFLFTLMMTRGFPCLRKSTVKRESKRC